MAAQKSVTIRTMGGQHLCAAALVDPLAFGRKPMLVVVKSSRRLDAYGWANRVGEVKPDSFRIANSGSNAIPQ